MSGKRCGPLSFRMRIDWRALFSVGETVPVKGSGLL